MIFTSAFIKFLSINLFSNLSIRSWTKFPSKETTIFHFVVGFFIRLITLVHQKYIFRLTFSTRLNKEYKKGIIPAINFINSLLSNFVNKSVIPKNRYAIKSMLRKIMPIIIYPLLCRPAAQFLKTRNIFYL